MKNIYLSILLILSIKTYAQVGILTDTPHSSSALEIESTNKGLLIPRIILTTNLNSSSPVSSPAEGLLIFNSGSNQTKGFYYWNGSAWVSTSFSIRNWSITGNSSTSINNNFIGTTDNQHFAIRTNNSERIRIESDGQVIIGNTSPYNVADMFTVEGNSTQTYAINAYSPGYGVYANAGTIGFLGIVDNEDGFGIWSNNKDEDGYGAMFIGSDANPLTLNNHSAGIASSGDDGIFAIAANSSTGIGIIAVGSGASSASVPNEGAGGAFTGQHGVYGKSNNSNGVGIVGIGNNGSNYYFNSSGSGGAFTGNHGIYSIGVNSSSGIGVIGVGNNGTYYLTSSGSGGAFTGTSFGVAGYCTQSGGSAVYGNAINGGYAVYAQGNFAATGSKAFVIDHPLDPENKILKHYCLESPEVLNMYRGNIMLDETGNAEIILPEYFMELNKSYSYSLTPIGKSAPNLFIKEEINNEGIFIVSGGEPFQKISWSVTAERNDPYLRQNPDSKLVEIIKEGDLKGKYLSPQVYNKPADEGIFYSEKQNINTENNRGKAINIEIKKVEKPSKKMINN